MKSLSRGAMLTLRSISLVCLVLTPMLISGCQDGQSASERRNPAEGSWVGTWSSSPQSPPMGGGTGAAGFHDETLRQIVHISIGGDWLRVRLSNRFGTEPLIVDAASIGIRQEDAVVLPDTLKELTFKGARAFTIPAGERVMSDPVQFTVADGEDLAVSIYVAKDTGSPTSHMLAWQTTYISPAGDFTATEDMPVAGKSISWFWLTGVEVLAHPTTQVVVAFGDSITEGFFSTLDANVRYPDELARRLLDRYKGAQKVAVLNAGISGNRVLNDVIGPSFLARFDRDVLTQAGITHVLFQGGINDLGLPGLPPFLLPEGTPLNRVSAEEMIAGYEQIIERAHAQGIKIFGGTLLPFQGTIYFNYFTSEGEEERLAINAWIRTSNAFDAVIDFDEALRDPGNPQRYLPVYDSGDHLHPNDAGYKAMSDVVDLSLFAGEDRIL
jgi:lysophospholipase L1-like esterase